GRGGGSGGGAGARRPPATAIRPQSRGERERKNMAEHMVLARNNAMVDAPCALCADRTSPCGLDVFLAAAPPVALVCDECTRAEAPELLYAREAFLEREAADINDFCAVAALLANQEQATPRPLKWSLARWAHGLRECD